MLPVLYVERLGKALSSRYFTQQKMGSGKSEGLIDPHFLKIECIHASLFSRNDKLSLSLIKLNRTFIVSCRCCSSDLSSILIVVD